MACDAGGVDDGAAAEFEHGGHLVLHRRQHAPHVDVEDPPIVLLADLCHRAGQLDAGVVERDVQPAKPLDGLPHRLSVVDRYGQRGGLLAYLWRL